MSRFFLSKEDILGADDRKTEEVHVPEWCPKGKDPADAFLTVRGLDGTERDAYDAAMTKMEGKNVKLSLENRSVRLVAKCVVDPSGKPLFSEREVAALGRKAAAPIARLFKVAARLSGIEEEQAEETEKNSEAAPSADSGSN